jgi:arylsulfatase A-like enzyme
MIKAKRNSMLFAEVVFGNTIGIALISSISLAGELQKRPSPHIVVILADDLGFGDLSCNGAVKISTPAFDQVSAEGVNFKNAYAASSMCSPARYSLMTGRYPWRTRLKKGVLTFFDKPLIEPECKNLGSMMKENGYSTAYVGKWHLGLKWSLNDNAPENPDKEVFDTWSHQAQNYIDFSRPVKEGPVERGFDYFYGTAGSNNMQPYVYIENDRVLQPPTESQIPYDHYVNALKASDWDIQTINEHLTFKAVEVINNHFAAEIKKPLFLYFATSAIHRPCLPTFTKGKSAAGLRGDLVMELDWTVERILKALKENHAYDNTLLIITSDNGPRPGDPALWIENYKKKEVYKGLYQDYFGVYKPEYINSEGNKITSRGWITYGHQPSGEYLGFKCDAWDGGFRVPFIVRWPGMVKPGSVNENKICTGDLMATLADLLGIRLNVNEAEDSYSFLTNLLDNNTPQVRKSLTLACGGCGAMVVIKDGYKFIEEARNPSLFLSQETHYSNGPFPHENQLYDLNNDPYEKYNLYNRMPEKAEELKFWMAQVNKHIVSESFKK